MKVYNSNQLIPFCPVPTYFGVKLNKSYTFRYYFVALRKKTIFSRHTSEVTCKDEMLAKTLRTAALSLANFTVKNHPPV